MKNFTIYEDMWVHGTPTKPAKESMLLNDANLKGKLCCLGFCCYSLGTPLEKLYFEIEIWAEFFDNKRENIKYLIGDGNDPLGLDVDEASNIVLQLRDANDFPGLTLSQRKKKLTELFNKRNLNPIFKPTAPKAFRKKVETLLKANAFI